MSPNRRKNRALTPLPSTNNDNGTPWYFKFVYTFGVPAALTLYLVWFISNNVDTRLTSISSALSAHQQDMAFSLKSNVEFRQQLYLTNILLQRICVNTAKDSQTRGNCFGPTQ